MNTKINDKGMIPTPKLIEFKNGEMMYIIDKLPHHYFILHGGFGISDIILKTIDVDKRIVFRYVGKNGIKYYVCRLKQFVESNKTHYNTFGDLQRFVPLKEMIEW